MQLEPALLFCAMNTSKPYIGDITFDAAHPRALAAFWAKVLRRDVGEESDEWAAVSDPNGGPRLCFQHLATPKIGKNRLHLDLYVQDMEAEVARCLALGARKMRVGEQNGVTWTVLLDPEDNEFCVQLAM